LINCDCETGGFSIASMKGSNQKPSDITSIQHSSSKSIHYPPILPDLHCVFQNQVFYQHSKLIQVLFRTS
jgi:hypothetical protein